MPANSEFVSRWGQRAPGPLSSNMGHRIGPLFGAPDSAVPRRFMLGAAMEFLEVAISSLCRYRTHPEVECK